MQEASSLTTTSSASASGGVLADLEALVAAWPETPAEDIKALGLDQPGVSKAVAAAKDKVRGWLEKCKARSVQELKKLIRAANGANQDLDPNDESAFRNLMTKKVAKLAKLQNDLKVASSELQSCLEQLGEPADAKSEPNSSAGQCESLCFYHVCVFTALCFFRNPDTFRSTTAGNKSLAQMKTVLELSLIHI